MIKLNLSTVIFLIYFDTVKFRAVEIFFFSTGKKLSVEGLKI